MSDAFPTRSDGRGTGAVAPRLSGGADYALWAPRFEAWCGAKGYGDVLTKEIKNWQQMLTIIAAFDTQAEAARDAQLDAALARLQAGGQLAVAKDEEQRNRSQQ